MASKYSVEYIAGGKVVILCRQCFFQRNSIFRKFFRYSYYGVTSFTQFYHVQVLLKTQSE